VCYTTFQAGINFYDGPQAFWKSYGSYLKRKMDIKAAMSTAQHFLAWLSDQKSVLKQKPLVLVIDEFDVLYSAENKNICESFLGTLRSIKTTPDDYNLQAVIALGPFSILEVSSCSRSPFNVVDSLPASMISLDDVKKLHQQFQKERSFEVDEEIALDVFARTNGHIGLTCLCYKAIDEEVAKGISYVTLDKWKSYALSNLVARMRSWATIDSIFKTLEKNEYKGVFGRIENFSNARRNSRLDNEGNTIYSCFTKRRPLDKGRRTEV
jgi:hypothetical protein